MSNFGLESYLKVDGTRKQDLVDGLNVIGSALGFQSTSIGKTRFLIMTNARYLVSRNKREGWYAGKQWGYGRHYRNEVYGIKHKVK